MTASAAMTKTTHTTFTIERVYDASPARVFAAWAQPEAKARWFVGPATWKQVDRSLQFEVGGREVLHGDFGDGRTSLFEARYHDIVPDQRIVYAYVMHASGAKISTSLATVTLQGLDGGRTRLAFTEQATFLDGFDDGGGRERGTGALLDNLGASLTPSPETRARLK